MLNEKNITKNGDGFTLIYRLARKGSNRFRVGHTPRTRATAPPQHLASCRPPHTRRILSGRPWRHTGFLVWAGLVPKTSGKWSLGAGTIQGFLGIVVLSCGLRQSQEGAGSLGARCALSRGHLHLGGGTRGSVCSCQPLKEVKAMYSRVLHRKESPSTQSSCETVWNQAWSGCQPSVWAALQGWGRTKVLEPPRACYSGKQESLPGKTNRPTTFQPEILGRRVTWRNNILKPWRLKPFLIALPGKFRIKVKPQNPLYQRDGEWWVFCFKASKEDMNNRKMRSKRRWNQSLTGGKARNRHLGRELLKRRLGEKNVSCFSVTRQRNPWDPLTSPSHQVMQTTSLPQALLWFHYGHEICK